MFKGVLWHLRCLYKSLVTLLASLFLIVGENTVLVVSHALNEGGASLVLVEAVELLKKKGFRVVIVSPDVGNLESTYRRMGINVLCSTYFTQLIIKILVSKRWRMIFVNSLLMYEWVENAKEIPILWWIHEGRTYTEKYAHKISLAGKDNLYIYCVSEWSRKCLVDSGFNMPIGLLYYGTKDVINYSISDREKNKSDTVSFALIGAISQRKRNIDFIKAIQMLSKEVLQNTEFTIIGKQLAGDEEYYIQFLNSLKTSVKDIHYVQTVPHDKMADIYMNIDVVVAVSDDDPLPVVVTEGFLHSKCVLLSSNCGQYALIDEGKNGYTFQAANVKDLVDKIEKIYYERTRLREVGDAGRCIYEKCFTINRFNMALGKLIDNITTRGE